MYGTEEKNIVGFQKKTHEELGKTMAAAAKAVDVIREGDSTMVVMEGVIDAMEVKVQVAVAMMTVVMDTVIEIVMEVIKAVVMVVAMMLVVVVEVEVWREIQ